MSKKPLSGQCLCGAVTVKAKEADTHAGACHCATCRKWGGGPLMALDCGTEVEFTGDEHVARYASSEWAERGFCTTCGTHLFYHLKGAGRYIMPAGLFNADPDLVFDHQIFIESKPAYYAFANDTKNMTGAEVFATPVDDDD